MRMRERETERQNERVGDALTKRSGGGGGGGGGGGAIPLPLSGPHFDLKKAALLTMLLKDYSAVSIPEDMLLKLEVLEELHLRSGSPLSPALPAAYCAIAVECTLKYLDLEPSPSNNPAYLSAVDRIWRRPRLQKVEGGSVLYSDELKRWSSDIEASFQDPEVRERLLTMNTRRFAMQRLRLLLEEAQNDLGPPFQDSAASMPTVPDTPTASTAHLHTAKLKEQEPPIENQIVDAPVENHSIDVPDENLYVDAPFEKESTHVPVENQCMDAPGKNQCIDPPIEKQSTDAPMGNEGADAPMGNEDADAPMGNEGADAPMGNEGADAPMGNEGADAPIENEGADKEDLHEQPVCQTTASHHTDGLEGEPGCRVQLPSPNRRKMPPLKFNEPPRIVRRRKAKKWSALEEETLRDAVNKIGEGNWKLILESHKDVFDERTQVDLKDKWRNLRRYGGR